ncbi:MAG: FmdB family zinc ribbon protein [Vicinamibacterales bacterium]
MPLYEYQCQSCGHRFEKIQKFSDPPESTCPTCGGAVEKLLSSPAIQFKGSGWYITDYARAGKGGDGKSDKADAVEKPAADSGAAKTTSDGAAAPAAGASTDTKSDAPAAKPESSATK